MKKFQFQRNNGQQFQRQSGYDNQEITNRSNDQIKKSQSLSHFLSPKTIKNLLGIQKYIENQQIELQKKVTSSKPNQPSKYFLKEFSMESQDDKYQNPGNNIRLENNLQYDSPEVKNKVRDYKEFKTSYDKKQDQNIEQKKEFNNKPSFYKKINLSETESKSDSKKKKIIDLKLDESELFTVDDLNFKALTNKNVEQKYKKIDSNLSNIQNQKIQKYLLSGDSRQISDLTDGNVYKDQMIKTFQSSFSDETSEFQMQNDYKNKPRNSITELPKAINQKNLKSSSKNKKTQQIHMPTQNWIKQKYLSSTDNAQEQNHQKQLQSSYFDEVSEYLQQNDQKNVPRNSITEQPKVLSQQNLDQYSQKKNLTSTQNKINQKFKLIDDQNDQNQLNQYFDEVSERLQKNVNKFGNSITELQKSVSQQNLDQYSQKKKYNQRSTQNWIKQKYLSTIDNHQNSQLADQNQLNQKLYQSLYLDDVSERLQKNDYEKIPQNSEQPNILKQIDQNLNKPKKHVISKQIVANDTQNSINDSSLVNNQQKIEDQMDGILTEMIKTIDKISKQRLSVFDLHYKNKQNKSVNKLSQIQKQIADLKSETQTEYYQKKYNSSKQIQISKKSQMLALKQRDQINYSKTQENYDKNVKISKYISEYFPTKNQVISYNQMENLLQKLGITKKNSSQTKQFLNECWQICSFDHKIETEDIRFLINSLMGVSIMSVKEDLQSFNSQKLKAFRAKYSSLKTDFEKEISDSQYIFTHKPQISNYSSFISKQNTNKPKVLSVEQKNKKTHKKSKSQPQIGFKNVVYKKQRQLSSQNIQNDNLQLTNGFQGNPYCFIDINISLNKIERVIIYRDTNLEVLCTKITKLHNLKQIQSNQLRNHLKKVFQQIFTPQIEYL